MASEANVGSRKPSRLSSLRCCVGAERDASKPRAGPWPATENHNPWLSRAGPEIGSASAATEEGIHIKTPRDSPLNCKIPKKKAPKNFGNICRPQFQPHVSSHQVIRSVDKKRSIIPKKNPPCFLKTTLHQPNRPQLPRSSLPASLKTLQIPRPPTPKRHPSI